MIKTNKKSEIEKLKSEVERLRKELKKRKKYGLVWEEKPEELVEMCKEKLPILKEVKNKEIITDKDKPVSLLIEGDNYHALSVLNYTHAKKIDVIYIDPPYNTGNKDFIFNDRYVDKEDTYRHSKWLAFMEKRLKLAKNLLKDTGLIFISIDDNEMAQLKLLMDHPDLFGEQNFIGAIVRRRRESQANLSRNLSTIHEYVLCYARSTRTQLNKLVPEIDESNFINPDKDPRGPYVTMPCTNKGGAKYAITTPTGKKYIDEWRFKEETYSNLLKDNRIVFPNKGNGKPRYKLFYSEKLKKGVIPNTWWDDSASNQEATIELKAIFNGKVIFNNPKPTGLIKKIIQLSTSKTGVVLDFMAGSGTTGHAVLDLNKEDRGSRRFILCTNNEDNNGNGYKIAEDICYPRIKKVIEGYKNLKKEKVEGSGGNLKYFRTDFVDAEPTDRNKIKLTEQATEMLCVKEETFEKVVPARRSNSEGGDRKNFKIFKNTNHYTGIIFDQAAIPAFKKVIKDIKGKFSVYVFSLGDETFDDEFEDIKQKVKLSPIPEAIMRVYRRIFK
jgi:adenine-specific DNA-methyltransferase